MVSTFSAFLLIVFNSAYAVIHAEQSRILVAKVVEASRWRVLKDVLLL